MDLELTILMPCLNEAETITTCISKAFRFLQRTKIKGEVLIADNGSTDGSQALAQTAGARIIKVAEKGYGNALLGGIKAAHSRYIIMADADDSYDFSQLDSFVEHLRQGSTLVMGNRFAGGIKSGAMPLLHRYLGNPVLSFIGRLFFRSGIHDFHCGLRGFDRTAILDLGLSSTGMEFASEMIVKATLAGLRISEVPTTLFPDGRSRPPHLKSWRDGWRHLRFLLMMSPRWLLLYPGLLFILLGIAAQSAIWSGPVIIEGVGFDIHTMLYASGMTILGLQLVVFSILTHAIGCLKGVLPISASFARLLGAFTLERGIIYGLLIGLLGFSLAVYSVRSWVSSGLSVLDPTAMMRIAIPSVTLMLAGAEIFFASFVLSFIDIRLESALARKNNMTIPVSRLPPPPNGQDATAANSWAWRLAVYAAAIFASITWTIYAGKDINWDTLNYHLYLGFSALSNRFGQDFFAASIQGYLNPYSDVPFYLMVKAKLPSILIGSLLASIHAISLWLTYELALALNPKAGKSLRQCLGVLALIFAILNPVLLQELGSTFTDISTGIFALAGWLALAYALQSPRCRLIALAGALVGIATALKLSNAVFAIAAVPVLALLPKTLALRMRTGIIFMLSCGLAFTIVAGPWAWKLWQTFGNPFFPLFNQIFASSDFITSSIHSNRFIPASFEAALLRPFQMALPLRLIHTEPPSPDVRYAALFSIDPGFGDHQVGQTTHQYHRHG